MNIGQLARAAKFLHSFMLAQENGLRNFLSRLLEQPIKFVLTLKGQKKFRYDHVDFYYPNP